LTRLNGHDVVRYMQSAARMEAHYAAMRLAVVDEIMADAPDLTTGRHPGSDHRPAPPPAAQRSCLEAEPEAAKARYEPVIADVARKVAAESAEAEWRHTGAINGEPAHVGTTSRRPTASMRRLVHAKHRTCVFPGRSACRPSVATSTTKSPSQTEAPPSRAPHPTTLPRPPITHPTCAPDRGFPRPREIDNDIPMMV